ncbi:hypothetical protein KKE60_06035 [Patescibacteria group bacterium]|nr:hypothetical protein [Patescibacteria group bacterium]
MKELIEDLVKGLETQGWVLLGGASTFAILSKDDKSVDISVNNIKNPTHLIVRYYLTKTA